MIKAVIYARVSSREQEREGFSIPAQLELLRNYALNHNITVVKEFEDAETAKKAGRTNYNEMLKFIKSSKDVNTILVEKTDRLYRNFKDYVTLEDYDLEVHLVKEGTVLSENSKSHEKFIHGIKVLMAKNYIDNLSEEVKKGLAQKVKEGYVISKPPYGYKKADKKASIIDEKTAPFVKRAYELYATGNLSLKRVAKQLYDEGFIYKESKPIINTSKLETILKSHFYYGIIEYKGEFYEGKHEPLITKELFEQVQIAFKKDNKPKYKDTKDFLLAGMITCADCGCQISGEIKKGRYIYYSCTGGKGECKQQHIYIREEELEKQLIDALKQIQTTEQQKQWIIQGLKESFADEQEYAKERISSLNKQKETLKERLSKIYLDKLDGIISEQFWLEQHNKWTMELMQIQSLIEAFEKSNVDFMSKGISILNLLTNIEHSYLLSDIEDKKQILNMVLQNSYLKGGKLCYTYKKPFNLFAKGLNHLENLGRKDSNLRDGWTKTSCLTTWRRPIAFIIIKYKDRLSRGRL